MPIEFELRRAVETGKVVFGSRQALKLLANRQCRLVLYAQDAPDDVKLDIRKLSSLAGIPALELPYSSKQLGIICGRPHVVAALAVVDPGYSRILEEVEALLEKKG
ncbi:MAG: 50S ribosomal protein L30e [bacterium]|nr:50S ribosomal protein L30e [bacterium]